MYNIIGLFSTSGLVIYCTLLNAIDTFKFLYYACLLVMPFFIGSFWFIKRKSVYPASLLSMISASLGIISSVTLEFTEFLSLIIIFILSSIFIGYKRWQAVYFVVFIAVCAIVKLLAESSVLMYDFLQPPDREPSVFIIALFLISIFSYALDIGLNVNKGLQDSDQLHKAIEKLKLTSVSKNKLYSIISHDLRGPIGSISYLLDLIKNKKIKTDEELIDVLAQTSNQVNQLLDNLLSWTNQHDDIYEKQIEEFDLYACVEESIELLSSISSIKNITILNQCPEGLIIKADRFMIFTAIRNLLSNAVKYSNRNSGVKVMCEVQTHHIKMMVIDNGVGIPLELQQSLFTSNIYNQTRSGTNNEKGTGLGLMLSAEFIRLNNGEIGFESKENKGSTFWFRIPVNAEH